MSATLITIFGIVGALVVMAIGFIVKKTIGSGVVDTTAAIVAFIDSALEDLGIASDNALYENISQWILSSLYMISASSSSSMTAAEKAASAIKYLKSLAEAADVTLTEDQILLFTNVLTAGFIFMNKLGIQASTKAMTFSRTK